MSTLSSAIALLGDGAGNGGAAVDVSRSSAALEFLPVPAALVADNQRFSAVNLAFAAAWGRGGEAVTGRTVLELFGSECAAAVRGALERALRGETVHGDCRVTVPGRGRRLFTWAVAGAPEGEAPGAIIRQCWMVLLDRTEAGADEEAVRISNQWKSLALHQAYDAVMVMDQNGALIEANPAAECLFGFTAEEATGAPLSELIIPPELRAAHERGFRRYLQTGQARVLGRSIELDAINRRGRRIPIEMIINEVAMGERRLFVANIRDVSAQREQEASQSALIFHDAVTGLPNRLMLLRFLSEGLTAGQPMGLIYLLLDRFASIRSTFGMAFADELLIGLAGRLTAEVRPGNMLARVEENVLALALRGPNEPAEIAAGVDRITSLLRTAVTPAGASVFLTASIGVATATINHERGEDLLRDAEIATARASEGSGGRTVWFDAGMHARVIEQVRTEHDLRHALENNTGLWVAYQPIVELVSGRLAGFEALVRWSHPERGLVPPVQFIPIAEDTGLVVPLGRWIMRAACQQLATWQRERCHGSPELFMSVNLSPRELEEPDFIDSVRQALAETGVSPSCVKLELTEGAVMRRPEESIVVLRELKSLGVSLSIDDFGTGYSSLSYLHKFPLDSIKVDRSFVGALRLSEENRSIVRIIVDLARLLGLDVIAEGIETTEDANLLQALSCDFGQGYLFSRPIPAAEAGLLVRHPPRWPG